MLISYMLLCKLQLMLPSMVELMKKGPYALKYYIPKANQCKHRKSTFSVKQKECVKRDVQGVNTFYCCSFLT